MERNNIGLFQHRFVGDEVSRLKIASILSRRIATEARHAQRLFGEGFHDGADVPHADDPERRTLPRAFLPFADDEQGKPIT